MNIIETIKSLIDWYDNNSKGCQDINALLDLKDKLATNSYYLAELAGDLKTSYNHHFFIRKINVSKSKQAFINEGKSATEAENKAILKHEEALNAQIEAESEAYKADLLLRQINKVIDAIQQRVSYLKIEKNESN